MSYQPLGGCSFFPNITPANLCLCLNRFSASAIISKLRVKNRGIEMDQRLKDCFGG